MAETCLGKKGYTIKKETLSKKQLNDLKKNMTVKPFVNQDYGLPPDPFPIYLENKNKIYIPKYYGCITYGHPDSVKLENGEEIKIEFNGGLRENQIPVVKTFMDSIGEEDYKKQSNGGIISVGCGFGKTVLALYLATQLKRKTLVIVHKTFLLNQWKERIIQYIPNARIGQIQASKIDVEDKDIVIGMLQSISMKDYDTDIFSDFGFTIIDECHHIAAEVFSKALHKINSKYMLGLSATPKRKDGLSKIFEWYLGPYLYIQDKDSKKNTDLLVNTIHYNHDCEFYSQEETSYGGKVCIPKMITNITSFNRRTEVIYMLLERSVKEGRKVLVLSDRRDHLKYIHTMVEHRELASIGYYIGGMKEIELKISEDKQILLGTYAMSSEGMDIPSLNTLIMASPKGEIEQSVGRILRKKHDINPIVYDIVDDFSVFTGQFYKRMRFYKKNNYPIYKTEIYDHDTMTKDEIKELLEDKVEYKKEKKNAFTDIKVCLI